MEYSLRPGACSDKNVWKMSSLGRQVNSIIPLGTHLIGDAGYTLATYLLTPFGIFDGMCREERQYNYLHSEPG